MSEKHTPGPWTVERYVDGDSLVIHSNDENRVCFMATPGSWGDPAKIEADARLIAAAPELLAALCEVAVLGSGKCVIGKPLADMVRAAIAKATSND